MGSTLFWRAASYLRTYLGSGSADNDDSHRPGNLHCSSTDSSGRTMDQYSFARFSLSTHYQGLEGSEVRHAKGSSLKMHVTLFVLTVTIRPVHVKYLSE